MFADNWRAVEVIQAPSGIGSMNDWSCHCILFPCIILVPVVMCTVWFPIVTFNGPFEYTFRQCQYFGDPDVIQVIIFLWPCQTLLSKCTAADALSRPHCPDPLPIVSVTTCVVSPTEMEKQQKSCPELQQLYNCPDLQIQRVPINGASIVSDVSTGSPRPLVPQVCRQKIFSAFHNLAHPGVCTTRRLISSRFVWRGLAKDVTQWTRSCLNCQRGKVTRHTKSRVPSIPTPAKRFSHEHVDPVPCTRSDRTLWIHFPIVSTGHHYFLERVAPKKPSHDRSSQILLRHRELEGTS